MNNGKHLLVVIALQIAIMVGCEVLDTNCTYINGVKICDGAYPSAGSGNSGGSGGSGASTGTTANSGGSGASTSTSSSNGGGGASSGTTTNSGGSGGDGGMTSNVGGSGGGNTGGMAGSGGSGTSSGGQGGGMGGMSGSGGNGGAGGSLNCPPGDTPCGQVCCMGNEYCAQANTCVPCPNPLSYCPLPNNSMGQPTLCDGTEPNCCKDLDNEVYNCGGCGVDCTLQGKNLCVNGSCQ